MALANRFDGPLIESLHDALTAMDRIGGQLVIQVHRNKYDSDGNAIPREQHNSNPGQWFTDAYVFSYETRDRNVQAIEPREIPLEQVDTKARPVAVSETDKEEDAA
jgi:hypothetical protein